MFVCMQKMNFLPPFFEVLQRYSKLAIFGYSGLYLAMTSKNDTNSLKKTLNFIFMQKNHNFLFPLS